MAFKKEDLQKIAEITKIPVADLEKAATDPAEVALTLPEGVQAFTADELATLKKNENDVGYKKAEKAIPEMLIKKYNADLGITFTGKTIDGLIDAVKDKTLADAGKHPDQRVTELNQKVTTLQQNITTFQTQMAEKDTMIAGLKDTYELYKHIPGPVEGGVQYQQDDVIGMMKGRGYEFKRDSAGNMGVYKGGELQADKLGNAVPVGDVVKGFMKSVNFITDEQPGPGGRGGSDKGGGNGKPRTASELRAKYESQGKSINGEEFQAEYEAAVKANDGFDPHK